MSLLVDIKKDFGRFRLDAAFETDSGSVMGLLGASGCGKSVTLKCVAGIERPDEGRIVLDGRVLFDSVKRIDLTPQQRRVGYLFQNYALFPNMTLAQNIAVGVRDRAKRKETVARLVKAFYLEGSEGKYPRQLSGGQQQRTALARILAIEPEALLLDEPFSALDSYLKWQVELELAELLDIFPGPVLFVTHDRDEVHRLCGRVCVLDSGRAQEVRSVEELFSAPGSAGVRLADRGPGLGRGTGGRPAAAGGAGVCGHPLPLPAPGGLARSEPHFLPRGARGYGGVFDGGDALHARRRRGLFAPAHGAAP